MGAFDRDAADPDDLVRGSAIRSALARFVAPVMAQQALALAANAIVLAAVGHLAGVAALAGISVFFPVLGLLLAVLGGIGSAASVLVGQAIGRSDTAEARRVAAGAVGLSLALGIAVAIVGAFSVAPALRVLGVPDAVAAAGLPFAISVLFGAPMLFANTAYQLAVQGSGDAMSPLLGAIVQIVLTSLLVPLGTIGFGPIPACGTGGAGVGYVLANLGAGSCVALALALRHAPLAPGRDFVANLRPSQTLARELIRLGLPSGVTSAMLSISEIVVLGLVARQGTPAIGAYGAVGQIVGAVGIPAGGVAGAASVFGAQAVGAARYRKLERIGLLAVAIGVAIAIPFALAIHVAAAPLMRVFVSQPETIAIGVGLVRIVAWSLPLAVATQAIAATLRAANITLGPAIVAVGAVWLVQVPLAFALAPRFGIDGIWIGYPVSTLAATLAIVTYACVIRGSNANGGPP